MHKTLRGVFMEPKPIPKRNFLKENKINIKRMQRSSDDLQQITDVFSNHSAPNKTKPHFITTVSSNRNENNFRKRNKFTGTKNILSKDIPSKTESRPSSAISNLTYCDQSIQTEYDIGEENFLKDTIIRYPSSTSLSKGQNNKAEDIENLTSLLKKENSSLSITKSVSIKTPSEEEDLNNEMNFNGMSERKKTTEYNNMKPEKHSQILKSPILDKKKSKRDKQKSETNFIPPNYKVGVVPKYIKERKEELANIIKQCEKIDINCPEGHIPLGEEDRLQALDIANKKYESLIRELNRMPMTCETLRIKHRKIEIEKELTKLEDSIRIFSRPKVYVKLME